MGQQHVNFGEQILLVKPSAFQAILRFVGYALPGLIIGGFGIGLTIETLVLGGPSEDVVIGLVVLGVGVVFLIIALLYGRYYTIALYEKGIVYNHRGKKLHELGYDEIGLLDIVERTKLWGIIPMYNIRQIIIDVRATLTRFNTPNFTVLADTLMAAHFAYFVKELTSENVFEASIPFGDDFKLKKGQFIFTSIGGNETVIPLEEVKRIDIGDGILHSRIQLMGTDDRGGTSTLLDESMLHFSNLEVMRFVVDLANGKKSN